MNTLNIKHLDINGSFSLVYETDMEGSKHVTMTFSGREIRDAYRQFIQYDTGLETELELAQRVEIWGRLQTGENLSNDYPEKTVRYINCALNGCEDCQKALRKEFAMYMAARTDSLLEDGIVFLLDSDAHKEEHAYNCNCDKCLNKSKKLHLKKQ
jgi:hypothetical protein